MPNWDAPKYYVYVSDAKVDMLYSQIPAGIRGKLAAELKIDLKVVSATLTPQSPTETRYSKLRFVGRYLEKHLSVGSVDVPEAWFGGTLLMGWGPIRDGRAIYFGAATDRTVLGLGGSPRHVVGSEGKADVPNPATSGAADLFDVLAAAEPGLAATPAATPAAPPSTSLQGGGLPPLQAEALVRATLQMTGPVQQLEFLAKRVAEAPTSVLRDSQLSQERILLGTPLYVAQVD